MNSYHLVTDSCDISGNDIAEPNFLVDLTSDGRIVSSVAISIQFHSLVGADGYLDAS